MKKSAIPHRSPKTDIGLTIDFYRFVIVRIKSYIQLHHGIRAVSGPLAIEPPPSVKSDLTDTELKNILKLTRLIALGSLREVMRLEKNIGGVMESIRGDIPVDRKKFLKLLDSLTHQAIEELHGIK